MSLKKGQAVAQRQNYSMHPDLIKAVIEAANAFNTERGTLIIQDRGLRVTYSKIAAALMWQLKNRYLTPDGRLTDELRLLLAQYEATQYEMTDSLDADEVLRDRQRRVAQLLLPTTSTNENLEYDDES
jgi:hypothetical protein